MTDPQEEGAYKLRAVVAIHPALDEDQRQVVQRSFGFEPYPAAQPDEEIARAMQIPLAKVRRLRARGLKALRPVRMVQEAKEAMLPPPPLRGEDRAIERLDRTRVA